MGHACYVSHDRWVRRVTCRCVRARTCLPCAGRRLVCACITVPYTDPNIPSDALFYPLEDWSRHGWPRPRKSGRALVQ
eukprot:5545312-Prymnesium_polylepis.1